jgi:hypothetical protein
VADRTPSLPSFSNAYPLLSLQLVFSLHFSSFPSKAEACPFKGILGAIPRKFFILVQVYVKKAALSSACEPFKNKICSLSVTFFTFHPTNAIH